MRNWILLAAMIGILGTGSSSAQTLQNSSPSVLAQRSPHVDSLRRVLKLSPHLKLNWATSKNGIDVLSVTDDFNRSEIGSDWAYAEPYWQILDGELDVTAEADHEWRYLAVFLPVYNTPERKIHSVSYRWGRNADELGIREAAHALMIDGPSPHASGYWLWHRTNWFEVWLWIIKNGTWEYTPGEGKEVDKVPAQLASNPVAGDVVTAYIRNEPDAVYFDYYVNGNFDGTVKDVTKEYANSDTWYVGAFIHGQELNNQIDDFTVSWLEGDVVAPAAVRDLRAIDSTSNSIALEWTSTGDNGHDGTADRLELRYSTSPINAANFANATLVPNLPGPAASGEKQTFTVRNLNSATTYYFALKIFDEVGNASPVSNLVKARTKSNIVATTLALAGGCNQTGEVNKNLPAKLIAKVTDHNGAAVSNHPVEFVVVSGNGTVDGHSSVTVNTDVAGEAKVTWKLGKTAGTQAVEIRANGLNGSPQNCAATAKAAAPAKLSVTSGNGQIVSIGQPAPSSLVARLVDNYNNANAGQSVVFKINSGGGDFLSGQNVVGKTYQTLTDDKGEASAHAAASNVYGDTTKIDATWKSSSGATTLTAKFFIVAARPDSAALIKGNNQTAARNTVLPESLAVKIFDAVKAPVKNYPVTFRIVSGGGMLANNQTEATVNTDHSGLAKTAWKLGSVAGVQQVEAKAVFNNKNLRNTPVVFKATAFIPSAVDEQTNAVPQQFALHQNFPNPFNPETTIKFDLPEAGDVEMNVLEVTGRQVRHLLTGQKPAGSHRVVWNGQDDRGRPVESGVYFIVLRAKLGRPAGEMKAMRKVALMR
ncbi:MAG: hypothetical protein ONB46_21115 [candidate division KSB1 bacterium]|nr:hypothetical protein [candidate division KSB1 bacterium]MDZ7368455.1 hypothetical protein [candidate division KSB1 bacterium]MDZ7406181.1 hypothetical protein [candidate division KSB1 bacterium]